ncbi:MAG: hypothetical protein HXS41_10985 [Theionarchaea archaeon]|nr:hypothetical protein [Theionarchaea archaeon]MBU7000527.1 hypothetical protein [Theionarchaea archaeon]MBU7021570.1 hypothetical protein [Theionarchaea archaeon]MBU7034101.1 hypothetical protein [Theionarchaea archaeon]MBU7039940.1 hypothetical protein [Theionarchaea archaeon]
MVGKNSRKEEGSYLEKKAMSLSREIGIQKEAFFETTFEEIENRLGVTDENILELRSSESHSRAIIRGSVFTHFALPLLKKDVVRKQRFIDRFVEQQG